MSIANIVLLAVPILQGIATAVDIYNSINTGQFNNENYIKRERYQDRYPTVSRRKTDLSKYPCCRAFYERKGRSRWNGSKY
uniref:Uncharacterized protein n=1 Tax=Podoviridae sp. ctIKM86 TaxID=2827729 RepID=A0A8S5SNY1_9CAUD|nr:MAG TPA: hypothetical protein [Podoviridae sp. ctIKM86]